MKANLIKFDIPKEEKEVNKNCMFYTEHVYSRIPFCRALKKLDCKNCKFCKEGDYEFFKESLEADCKEYESKHPNTEGSSLDYVYHDEPRKDCMMYDSRDNSCKGLETRECKNCRFFKKGSANDYYLQTKDLSSRRKVK